MPEDKGIELELARAIKIQRDEQQKEKQVNYKYNNYNILIYRCSRGCSDDQFMIVHRLIYSSVCFCSSPPA